MRKLLFLSFITLTLLACNKEKQIQKDLYSKGGEWNINEYHNKTVSTHEPDNSEVNLNNVGTLTFKDDFTGIMKWTYEGDLYIENFSYSSTDKRVKIDINDGDFRGDYEISDRKKGSMTLTSVENYTAAPPGQSGNVGSGTQTIVLKLTKKK